MHAVTNTPKPPATYVVEEDGRPVKIVLAHRPERAIAAVVEPRFTARIISPFELLTLQRTAGLDVLDPHGALPARAEPIAASDVRPDWRDDCSISIDSDPGRNPQSPLPLTGEPSIDAEPPAASGPMFKVFVSGPALNYPKLITLAEAAAYLPDDLVGAAENVLLAAALHERIYTEDEAIELVRVS